MDKTKLYVLKGGKLYFLVDCWEDVNGVPILPREGEIVMVDDEVYKVFALEWHFKKVEHYTTLEIKVLVKPVQPSGFIRKGMKSGTAELGV